MKIISSSLQILNPVRVSVRRISLTKLPESPGRRFITKPIERMLITLYKNLGGVPAA